MSGVSDEDMRASVFVVNADRAIDARPAELFETADLRAQWVADVVKACRT